jgi:two-component system chemotaxis sensor kinase CheA
LIGVRAEIVAAHQKQQEKLRQDFIAAGSEQSGARPAQSLNIAVVKAGNNLYGLVVDRIMGTEEIVVKPLHRAIKSLGIYSGPPLWATENAL